MPLTDMTGLRDQSAPTGRAPGPNSCAITIPVKAIPVKVMPAKSVVDIVANHRVNLFFMVNS
ncbi:MAG: hypothetical protein VX173_01935, partial [Pseudomonadota bacterium]|nr:hypothetical protein [Pseudomonadota bacterium]